MNAVAGDRFAPAGASRRLFVAVAAAALSGGCGDLLAKNNPCGGQYPSPGDAEIFDPHLEGTMDGTPRGALAFDSADAAASEEPGACATFASGLALADGSGKTRVTASCGGVIVIVTLPDVRGLAEGATASAPVAIQTGYDGSLEGTDCREASATQGGRPLPRAAVEVTVLRRNDRPGRHLEHAVRVSSRARADRPRYGRRGTAAAAPSCPPSCSGTAGCRRS